MATNSLQNNQQFLLSALEKNYYMPTTSITQAGQVLDMELDGVPGWLQYLDVSVYLDLKVTCGAAPTAPSVSQFAPWNLFQTLEVSLGGGPFQRVNPYFHYLRDMLTDLAFGPDYSVKTMSYASQVYNVPVPTVTASASTDTYWRFNIRVPLQVQHGSVFGLLPAGNASTKVKLRMTVAPSLYGTDQYQNALYGGTNITSVTIGNTQTSYVQPNLWFLTTPPTAGQVSDPTVGYVLNVQEKSTALTNTGSLTPVKFPDPFKYLRLFHILIDNTGAPITPDKLTNFELDLLTCYPSVNFASPGAIQNYLAKVRRKYGTDLPNGVYLFDLISGSDPVKKLAA